MDIGNGTSLDGDMMEDDDFDDEALERMGGEEMAIMMGVTTDTFNQQM